MTLIQKLAIVTGLLAVVVIWATVRLEAADPCVRYQDHGFQVLSMGESAIAEPISACAERKSGWKADWAR